MDERRRADRYEVWFPMRLEVGPAGERIAVSQNVSQSGMLVASVGAIAEGAAVTVRFRIPPDPEEHEARATVVRSEPNERDPDGLWPYRVAVAFEDVRPELEPLLEESAKRQS
jgi:hypothetical protein